MEILENIKMEMGVQEKLKKLSEKAHNILLEAQKLAEQNDIAFRFTFPWIDDKLPYYRKKVLSQSEILYKTIDIINDKDFYKENEKIKNDVISYLLNLIEKNDLTEEEYIRLF